MNDIFPAMQPTDWYLAHQTSKNTPDPLFSMDDPTRSTLHHSENVSAFNVLLDLQELVSAVVSNI